MDFQFYPTPPALARKMWEKFKNQDFERVLEPSGGDGALIKARPGAIDRYHHSRRVPFDACEIDVTKHPILREMGADVVGMDFLQFGNGSIYSHIIMNGPFADGAKHVLKAWDILWSGEIVALVNAETLRNLCSQERQFLMKLIVKHGDVEFIENAFMDPDARRKTPVDVAIIYLNKEADVQTDITGDLLSELSEDEVDGDQLAEGYEAQNQLAMPRAAIENLVLAFKASVQSMRESVVAEAKARYYESLLGDTMAVRCGEQGKGAPADHTVNFVRKETAERYDKLKDRAWAGVLRSSQFEERLSSSAQKRVESEFNQIKKLEFTLTNIYGFLLGLVESQGQIQIEMALDCFDSITKYHSENTVFYRGWKSNDKHRTCGYRIKTTRFILPGFRSYSHAMDWDSMKRLSDFDKVFALVDGKAAPEVSLVKVFTDHFSNLRRGERISSSYFDVRYYAVGTVHFFARDKALIDRFNRLVGRHRQWLPPETEVVSKEFWLQYDKADKFDAEVRAQTQKVAGRSFWNHPLQAIFNGSDAEKAKAHEQLDTALAKVQERHGISVDFQLGQAGKETGTTGQLLLAA